MILARNYLLNWRRCRVPGSVTVPQAFSSKRHCYSTSPTSEKDDAATVDTNETASSATVGYGPFSTSAKARVAKEKRRAQGNDNSPAEPSTVMHNVQLNSNLLLRLSLAGITHPSQLGALPYRSEEWRQAFIRLYRAILRLHNKTVAVSLETSRGRGPEAAIAEVTSIHGKTAVVSHDKAAPPQKELDSAGSDEVYLRYLLTPEQREFGNQFVNGEFQRHIDADAYSATQFYRSWYDYVLQLASGVTNRELTETEKRLLSDEQMEYLRNLHSAFVNLRTTTETPNHML